MNKRSESSLTEYNDEDLGEFEKNLILILKGNNENNYVEKNFNLSNLDPISKRFQSHDIINSQLEVIIENKNDEIQKIDNPLSFLTTSISNIMELKKNERKEKNLNNSFANSEVFSERSKISAKDDFFGVKERHRSNNIATTSFKSPKISIDIFESNSQNEIENKSFKKYNYYYFIIFFFE